jgi:hypothetical protein
MEFALSLGFPHPDLMLGTLTLNQYSELRAFFRLKNREEEERKQEIQESRLKSFFGRKIAKQNRGKGK